MPRTARIAPGGLIYHVLNRGVGKMTLSRWRKDFEAFQRCLVATQQTTPMRILAYCVMMTENGTAPKYTSVDRKGGVASDMTGNLAASAPNAGLQSPSPPERFPIPVD